MRKEGKEEERRGGVGGRKGGKGGSGGRECKGRREGEKEKKGKGGREGGELESNNQISFASSSHSTWCGTHQYSVCRHHIIKVYTLSTYHMSQQQPEEYPRISWPLTAWSLECTRENF